MAYLLAAYAVLWAVSFSLVFSMIVRQRRIESELDTLRRELQDHSASSGR